MSIICEYSCQRLHFSAPSTPVQMSCRSILSGDDEMLGGYACYPPDKYV